MGGGGGGIEGTYLYAVSVWASVWETCTAIVQHDQRSQAGAVKGVTKLNVV